MIRTARHYLDTFRLAVASGGLPYAMRRSTIFLTNRTKATARRMINLVRPEDKLGGPPPFVSPFAPIIETLPTAPNARPLLLIVSDSKIRQCVHFRIEQKLRYLEQIGVRAMHLSPANMGRVRSFLGLAHTVIIYRTALDEQTVTYFRDAGAKVYFEFDDLVVGSDVLRNSGILDQVTEHQAISLSKLADDFLETAQLCDGIIVSTPFLAEVYAKPGHGLADLPCHVLPNFIEVETYNPPAEKNFTFAYTSPSGSILQEMAMLTDFLTAYDREASQSWSILVMGNPIMQKRLNEIAFDKGVVVSRPFSDFSEYLQTISSAETVLIPLSDSAFNRSKTAIRLMDAALAGSQAVFCPVGAYETVRAEMRDDSLCIPVDAWAAAGAEIAPVLARLPSNVADLQDAVRAVYGTHAARQCYRDVFLGELNLKQSLPQESTAAS